jgi:hypothetical protein
MLKVRPDDLPRRRADRKAQFYMAVNEIVWWDGKNRKCLHKKSKSLCGYCASSASRKNAKLCQHEGCYKTGHYANKDRESRYCKTHAQDGMILFDVTCCTYIGCNKQACYATPPGTNRVRCKTHAELGMVIMGVQQCNFTGCTSQCVFGLLGGKAERCSKHREPNMVDVKNLRCLYEACPKYPVFANEGEKKGQYCKDHKQPSMVDVRNARCLYEGCKVQPTFGFKNTSPSHCLAHKLPGMADVRSRLCEHPDCDKQPGYGLPGHPPRHCHPHRVVGDIRHYRRTCIETNCNEVALYGTSNPSHCEAHQTLDEMDLVQRECSSCHLPEVLDANNHCSVCDPSTFARVYLAKQKVTKAYIDEYGPLCLYYDQIIKDGCGLERPDMVYYAKDGSHFVVLEVDEEQHQGRNQACERARMADITASLGQPTLFIRFNPDKYRPAAGENEVSLGQRHAEVLRVLEHWRDIPLPLEGQTFAIYLYYNGYRPETSSLIHKIC